MSRSVMNKEPSRLVDSSPYARSMECSILNGVVLSICTYPDFYERLPTSIVMD